MIEDEKILLMKNVRELYESGTFLCLIVLMNKFVLEFFYLITFSYKIDQNGICRHVACRQEDEYCKLMIENENLIHRMNRKYLLHRDISNIQVRFRWATTRNSS
jgi:hypothetical protein